MCSLMNIASAVPVEVITKIALELQSLAPKRHHGLISMSHVCKSWREAVISYPLLWTSIDRESEMVTRMCLERSGSLPLIVSLSDFDRWSSRTRRLVGSHACRFEELRVDGLLSSGLSEIFTNLMSSKAPILRELSFLGYYPTGTPTSILPESLHSPLLSEDIPTLQKLTLFTFPPIRQLSVLRHLTEVDLENIGCGSANAILDLLSNNPRLQRVCIVGPLDDIASPREDLSIFLRHLREFVVIQCDATDILRCLHIPYSEPLEMEISESFEGPPLPTAYQPYSVLQLARDIGYPEVYLYTSPRFYFNIYSDSIGGMTAELDELPQNTSEALGSLTLQLVKRLRFWEVQEDPEWHPLESGAVFHHLDRLETLALDCFSTSLHDILFVLSEGAVCPFLHTLVVRLPDDTSVYEWRNSFLDIVCARADHGNPIRRLRFIVSFEEDIALYTGIFDSFVQEVEILVYQPNEGDERPWVVHGGKGTEMTESGVFSMS